MGFCRSLQPIGKRPRGCQWFDSGTTETKKISDLSKQTYTFLWRNLSWLGHSFWRFNYHWKHQNAVCTIWLQRQRLSIDIIHSTRTVRKDILFSCDASFKRWFNWQFSSTGVKPFILFPSILLFLHCKFYNKLVFEYNKFPFLSTTITFAQKKKKRKTRCIAKGFIVLSDRDGRRVNLDKSVAEIVDKMATTRAQLAQNNNQIVCLECYLEFCNIFSHKQCELIIYWKWSSIFVIMNI